MLWTLCESCFDSTFSESSLSIFRYNKSRRQIKLQRSHIHKFLLMLFLLCSLFFLSLLFIILCFSTFHTHLKKILLNELKPELKLFTVIQRIQNHYFVGIPHSSSIKKIPVQKYLNCMVLDLLMIYRVSLIHP